MEAHLNKVMNWLTDESDCDQSLTGTYLCISARGEGSVFANFRFTAALWSITAVRSKNGLYKKINQILLNK